jgi:hypothetical protein
VTLTDVRYGLNYSSAHWNYAENDGVLAADFGLFQRNHISLICLWLHWSRIQPSLSSSYDKIHLGRIANLCSIAAKYGILVDIDFHSGSGSNKKYGLPPWFSGTFDEVATSSIAKTQWINMEKHVIQYLLSIPNIRSWQLFNEPWADTSSLQTNYRTLFVETTNALRALTSKPLTIRFGASSFTAHNWKDWAQLYQICDFMALNWYPKYHTVPSLDAWMTASRNHGKDTVITEYGEDTAEDCAQAQSLAEQISLFKARRINTTLVCQYGRLSTGHYFDLLNLSTEEPRPAFYEVSKANAT